MIKAGEKRPLACTTCAKAKARCIPGPSIANGRCERCHRLSKPCGARTPAPPRAKSNIKRSRVAELEKRLSELEGGSISIATASKGLASPAPSAENSEGQTENGHESTCFFSKDRPKASRKVDLLLDHIFPASQETSPWPSKESVESARKRSRESLWPLEGEAEVILGTYKAKLEQLFPFVVVPDLKAAELKQARPFLWKAIMMVGTFLDGARNMKLGEELLAHISHAAMVEGEHGLDILQGVQLLVAWFHHALKNSRLTNLLFLARSLCLSLGLGGNSPVANTNLDHLRAYAGTYYVNTLVFTTNKRTEVLMNTIFLDKCCSMLEQENQLKSDELLVKLVRVQQLAQTISLTVAMEPDQQAMQLPMTIVVQSFQDQLASLQQSLSPELAENPMMTNHIAIAHVLLTEWAISDRHHNTSAMALTDRLRLLWSCARSLHSIFHVRKYIWTDLDNLRFLCLHGSDLSYALITGVRLVTLRLPGWSLEQIDREMCFSSVMDDLVNHLYKVTERRKAGAYSSSAVGSSTYADPIEGLWSLCAGLRVKIKAEMAKAIAESKTEMDGFETQPVDLLSLGLIDDLGSTYWKDFMTDAFWNGQADTSMGFDSQF